MAISSIVWSWLFLVPLVPSIIVAIFTLYHLLADRNLRTALNNHAIILLLSAGLIVSLTDIVWIIYYFRTGIAPVSTPTFCLTWMMMDTAAYVSIQVLMAWTSIERHILIFYPHWFGTKIKCFLFHYLSLAVCFLYPTIFYLVIFVILPCKRPFYYDRALCGRYPCLYRFSRVALWDSVCNFMMPAFIIVFFSITLLIRVLYSRYRVRRRIDWRKYRKLTVQLLPISVLYTALKCPPMIMFAAFTAGLDLGVGGDYFSDSIFFIYWTVLLTPFASVVSLPNLRTKFKKVICMWRRIRTVAPRIFPMTPSNVARTPVAIIR